MSNNIAMKFFLTFITFIAAAAMGGGRAWAYLDPGTGMSFVSGIGAFIAGIFAIVFGAIVITFKKWTRAIRSLFAGKKGGGDHSQ